MLILYFGQKAEIYKKRNFSPGTSNESKKIKYTVYK